MSKLHSDRRVRSLNVLALASLILIPSQPGCDQPAPAREAEQRIEARKKRAETLKGEIGYAPQVWSKRNSHWR